VTAWRTPAVSREQLIDAVMDGYVGWREASAAANSAYQGWREAVGAQRAEAFELYQLALDDEERAAVEYARLIARASMTA
jgi:hypothetical protein